MKKTLLLLLVTSSLVTSSIAQNFAWVKQFGGSSSQMGESIVLDTFGNVYTTGSFRNTTDFDPGVGVFNLTSTGDADIFISKLDASGNFIWAKSFSGPSGEYPNAIAVDASENVYITGYFQDTADFDPGAGIFNLMAVNGIDIFVVKLNPSGDFLWAVSFGGISGDFGNSLAADNLGNVYVTGTYGGTVDFDPGPGTQNLTSSGSDDFFISKLTSIGNLAWVKSIGGTSGDEGTDIVCDTAGYIYLSGSFSSTVDFDPGGGTFNLTTAGNTDAFISKLDSSGNFIWAKSFGGSGADRGLSISLDELNNVYTSGMFQGTSIDFDPGPGIANLTAQGSDGFISKFDNAGNFTWAKCIGGSGVDQLHSHFTDSLGNVFLSGEFSNTVDFDPGPGTFNLTSAGSADIYVSKLDPSGNFSWAVRFGSNFGDRPSSIVGNNSGDVYTTGSFQLTVDFNPDPGTFNLTSTGASDCFILKLIKCPPSYDTLTDAACNSYILNGTTYTNSGIYYQTLANVNGCDSVITLNLTINNATFNTITTSACDSYFLNGTTYTSSGTYTQMLTNAAGCDSTLTLNLTINANTSSTINDTACDDYVLNGTTYNTSGTYTQTIPNADGCDSIITLNLTIKNSTSSTLTTPACDSLTLNGTTYTSSGTFTQTLTNAAGCDSILTLNLTINTVNIGVTNTGTTATANAIGATYQWVNCDSGFTIVPGATAQSFTPIIDGNYAVIVTQNSCTDTSACEFIISAEISQQSQGFNVDLYPNPGTNQLNIKFNSSQLFIQIKIIDVAGRVLKEEKYFNTSLISLDIDLPAGVYEIQIQNNNGESTVKKWVSN